MSTSHAVLGLLQPGPCHGYDLKRAYDTRFPFAKPLAYAQVYATLQRLLRDGFVEVAEQQPGAGPERTVYAITEAGRAHVRAWAAEPEPPAPHAANVLYTKLVLSLLAGEDAGAYLDVQRRAHLARMRELTEARRRGTVAERLGADYALHHLEADIKWLETTASRLATLESEVA